jgi:hypothetical protein
MLVVTVLLATHIRAAVAAAQGLLAAFKLVLAAVLLRELVVWALQAALLAHLFTTLAAVAAHQLAPLEHWVVLAAMAVVVLGAVLSNQALTQLLIRAAVVAVVPTEDQQLPVVLAGRELLSFLFQVPRPQPLVPQQ